MSNLDNPKAGPEVAQRWWLTLGANEQRRTRAWNALLRRGDKYPCGDCGKFTTATELHTLDDCHDFIAASRLVALSAAAESEAGE